MFFFSQELDRRYYEKQKYLKELVIDNFIDSNSKSKVRKKKSIDSSFNFPLIEKNPGAPKVLFLDFNGHSLKDVFWLIVSDNEFIDSINLSPPSFTVQEISKIVEIVYEDFLMFNVNVTTSEEVFLQKREGSRQRVIITPSYQWQEFATGGVARLNSFGRSDSPCFVFLYHTRDPRHIAETISHEIGHTLGLRHDGRISPKEEYYSGNDLYGPIMGTAYHSKFSHWSNGGYNSANNFQEDYQVMTQEMHGFSFRSDDVPDSFTNALNFPIDSSFFFKGMITSPEDQDYFQFETKGGLLELSVTVMEEKSNLLAELTLYDEFHNEINRQTSFNHYIIDILEYLDPGMYYFKIDGVGFGDTIKDGFTDYGSIGSYSINVEIISTAVMSAGMSNDLRGFFYPNPAQGIVYFSPITPVNEVLQVKLYDHHGKEVYAIDEELSIQGLDYSLGLSRLSTGVYYAVIRQDGQYYSEKILVYGF